MSSKTKRTLNIKAENNHDQLDADKQQGQNEETKSGLFDVFPNIDSKRKTETLSIRLTRDLSDKLTSIKRKTGMSTSSIAYEILDRSIDEVMKINKIEAN